MQRTDLEDELQKANKPWLLGGLALTLGSFAMGFAGTLAAGKDLVDALGGGLVSLLGLPSLAGFYLLWRYFKVLAPGPHPVLAALDKERRGASRELAAELRAGYAPVGSKGLLTPHWFFRRSFGWFEAVDLQDLVWAYLKVTKTVSRPSGRVSGQYSEAVVCFGRQGGKELRVDALTETDVTLFLQDLRDRAPWAQFGYSDALKMDWGAPRRKKLIADARARRDAALQPPAAPPAAGA